MGRAGYVYADGDRKGNTARRCDRDRMFIAIVIALRDAGDLRGLAALLKENPTEWKEIAIKRALKVVILK